ncbi:MAG: hypothetical protein ABW185_13360 [Sedimenticola sp.]
MARAKCCVLGTLVDMNEVVEMGADWGADWGQGRGNKSLSWPGYVEIGTVVPY